MNKCLDLSADHADIDLDSSFELAIHEIKQNVENIFMDSKWMNWSVSYERKYSESILKI